MGSKIQDSWEVLPSNLASSTCPNHPNPNDFDLGWDPRSKIALGFRPGTLDLGSQPESKLFEHNSDDSWGLDPGPSFRNDSDDSRALPKIRQTQCYEYLMLVDRSGGYRVYTHIHVYTHIFLYIYIYVYIYLYIYAYIYMCIYTYTSIHIYIYIHTNK